MNYDRTNQNRLSLALHYNCFTVMVKHILRFLPVTLRNLDSVTPLNHQPWPQHSVGWPHHGQILADATSLDHMLLLGQFSVFSENQTNLHVSNFIHRNFNNVKKNQPLFLINKQIFTYCIIKSRLIHKALQILYWFNIQYHISNSVVLWRILKIQIMKCQI